MIAAAPDLPIHRRFDMARRIPFSNLLTRTLHPQDKRADKFVFNSISVKKR